MKSVRRLVSTVNGNTGPACAVISADSLRTTLFLEALASPCRQYKTSSLWPWLLTDAISHTGSKSTCFQSHLCCDGNCSSLSHKSAPPFALQAKIYLYSHKHTHTNTQTNSRVTLPESKSTPSKFVSVLLFISFSLCSRMLELH